MNNYQKQKIHFNRFVLGRMLIYLGISIEFITGCIYVHCGNRYVNQVLGMLGVIFLLLTLISFGKLFTKEIRLELYRRITSAIFNATRGLRVLINKVREKLGLDEFTILHENDEKSIVVEKVKRRRHDRPKPRKYTDMEDNRERIRFLWTKHIIDSKTKYKQPTISQTPAQIGEALELGEESEPLFELYYTARYADETKKIGDEDVKKQVEFVGTKGKI